MKSVKAAALIMSLSIAGAALCACNNQPDPVSLTGDKDIRMSDQLILQSLRL